MQKIEKQIKNTLAKMSLDDKVGQMCELASDLFTDGALSIMVNSGNDNGMPFHASYELLTKWLKQDLQWDGMIVTYWTDIDNLYKRDHVAHDKKEAIAMAITPCSCWLSILEG